MELKARKQAQQRADRIAAFRAELAELEREQGLALTPEQRVGLEAHLEGVLAELARQYGVDVTEPAKRIAWGMRIATLLGSVAFGAALVLFLHRIWGVLPTWTQVAVLSTIPLLLLVATECVSRRRVDRFYTSLLGLATGVAFVMELNALGSVFNLASSCHALLVWAAFAILVAYAYDLPLLLGAGLVLACSYTGALWVAATGGHWESFPERAEFLIPAAAVLYAIPWVTAHRDRHDFSLVYRVCGAALTLLALLIRSQRDDFCCSSLPPRVMEGLYQLAGLGLSAGVVCHGLRLGKSCLVNLGAAGFVVFLFLRLHAWWWNWMPKYLFFLSIGIIALLLLLPFRRMRRRLSERGAP